MIKTILHSTQGHTESLTGSRMQSFDTQDFMDSPLSVVSMEEEKSVSGDWVDKVMVKSHLSEEGGHSPDISYQKNRRDTSKVHPEQSLSKVAVAAHRRKSLDDGSGRHQSETTDEGEELEIEASDCSDHDYQCQENGGKVNGGGTKAKKPTQNQRQMKSPQSR